MVDNVTNVEASRGRAVGYLCDLMGRNTHTLDAYRHVGADRTRPGAMCFEVHVYDEAHGRSESGRAWVWLDSMKAGYETIPVCAALAPPVGE